MGLIATLLGAEPTTIERRTTPAAWMVDWLNDLHGGTNASGISVNETTALKYTAFWAAVDAISRAVAQLPLKVYSRQADGGRDEANAHPVYRLLHTRPNTQMSSYNWRALLQMWVLTWGNGYAEIKHNGAGRATSLNPIAPDIVQPKLNAAGEIFYEIGPAQGSRRQIDGYDVLHIRGAGDDLQGYSPVRLFRETIGLGLAGQKHGAAFFGNGARPGGILEHPGQLGDGAIKRLRTDWKKLHGGPEKANEIAILEEGLKWHETSMPHDDAQFLETRQFQVVDIARIFHIPPHKLQDLVRATFSNIEHQAIEYVQDCLGPWLVNWEQELNYKLFREREWGTFYTQFNADGLQRGDSQARGEFYSKMWGIGALSQNEIRAKENLNPIDGGDRYFVPVNMQPADRAGVEPEPQPAAAPAPDGGDDADQDAEPDAKSRAAAIERAHAGLFLDLCTRIITKEITALRRAAQKPVRFGEKLDAFYAGHAEFIHPLLLPAAEAYAAAVGMHLDAAAVIGEFARNHAEFAHGRLWGVPEKRLNAKIDEWEANGPAIMVRALMQELKHAHAKAGS